MARGEIQIHRFVVFALTFALSGITAITHARITGGAMINSSGGGKGGNVTVKTTDTILFDGMSSLRQSCAARYSSCKLSSLASPGRGGMPFEPGGFMPSPLFQLLDSSAISISQDRSETAQTLIASVRPIYSIVSPCGKL